MSHFVLLLDSYVKSIIIEQSWIILKDELSNKATSIDAIFEAHTSYINRILFRLVNHDHKESPFWAHLTNAFQNSAYFLLKNLTYYPLFE
jgi:hypothetical protein